MDLSKYYLKYLNIYFLLILNMNFYPMWISDQNLQLYWLILSVSWNFTSSKKVYCKKSDSTSLSIINSQNFRCRSKSFLSSSCRWILYGWNLFRFNISHADLIYFGNMRILHKEIAKYSMISWLLLVSLCLDDF